MNIISDTTYSSSGHTANNTLVISDFATLTINSTTETISSLTFSGEGGKVLVENTSTTNPIFVGLGGNFKISENGELDVNGGLIELATGDGATKTFTLPKDVGNNEYTNLGAVWVGTDTFRDGTEYKVTYGEIDQLTDIVDDASLKNFFTHDTTSNQIEFLEAPANGDKIWIPNVQISGIATFTCTGQINATNCALEFDSQKGDFSKKTQVFNTVGIVQTSTDYMNNRRQVGSYNFLHVGSKAQSYWDFYGMAETIILRNCVFSSRDTRVVDTNGASKVEAEEVAFINRHPTGAGQNSQNSFFLGGQNSRAYGITIASPCRFRVDSNRGIIKRIYHSIKFYTTQSHTQIYHVFCKGFDNLFDDYTQIPVGSGGNALVYCETGTSGNTFNDFNVNGTSITYGLLDRGVGTRANKWNVSTNFNIDVNKDNETSSGEFKNFTNQNLINNSAGTLLPTDGEVERMLIRSNDLDLRCGLSSSSMTNASTGLLYTNTSRTQARIAGCFSRPNANTTDRTYTDSDYKYAGNNRLHIKNINGGGSFESRAYRGVTGVNGFVFSDSGDFTYTVQLRKIGGTYSSAFEITDTSGTGLAADNTALSNAYSALTDGDANTVQYKINFSKNTGTTYDDYVNYFGLDVTTDATYEAEFLIVEGTLVSAPNILSGSRVQIYNVSKSVELDTQILTTNGYNLILDLSANVNVDDGDTLRLRATCTAGAEAFLPVESFGVINEIGITFGDSQIADTIYNDNAINADNITTISADYPNVQIDISDGDGIADVKEFYAFYVKQTTSSTGIEEWFGAIDAIDHMNYRVNTAIADIKLQNRGSTPLVISGARIFRDNKTSILHADAGDQPMTQDNGELIQYIKGQVDDSLNNQLPSAVATAINGNATISGIDKNSKLIPALL